MYICVYIYACNAFGPGGYPGGKHVFKMASYQLHRRRLCTSGAQRSRDLEKSITSFYPGRLTTAPTRLEFVWPLFQLRSDRWRRTVYGSIASDMNVSFKQLCSPVTAITGPWNCVVYRDIHLLKANSCSLSFTSNCVGNAAPKRSCGCFFFLLANLRHTSARGPSAQCVRLVYSFILAITPHRN